MFEHVLEVIGVGEDQGEEPRRVDHESEGDLLAFELTVDSLNSWPTHQSKSLLPSQEGTYSSIDHLTQVIFLNRPVRPHIPK
jgi:hypothetical protein